MEEKFSKVYRILKWVMLGIFLFCVLVLFIPESIVPFDIDTFRSYSFIYFFIAMLVSLSAFLYFLIYPALERAKAALRKNFLEQEEIKSQLAEINMKLETAEKGKEGTKVNE